MSNPYWQYCTLALHCNGVNNGKEFVDERFNQVEPIGAIVTSTAQSKFNGSSLYCDGSGNYLRIIAANLFNVFTGEFTVRCFARVDLAAERVLLSLLGSWTSSVDMLLETRADCTLRFYAGNAVPISLVSAAGALSNNAWFHAEAGRDAGGTTRLFLNGNVVASHTGSVNLPGSTNTYLRVGLSNDNTTPLLGYLAEIEIYKKCLHTSNFTPPAAPFESDATAHKMAGRPSRQLPGLFPGRGYIAGTVKEGSVVKSRTVRLYERDSGILVASTVSANDGAYRFDGVDTARKFIAMAVDDDAGIDYDPAAVDRIIPSRLY